MGWRAPSFTQTSPEIVSGPVPEVHSYKQSLFSFSKQPVTVTKLDAVTWPDLGEQDEALTGYGAVFSLPLQVAASETSPAKHRLNLAAPL